MIRNKQRIYIKRAFKNSTFINEDNEEITYLALLRKELKKYNIYIYVFREWIYQRNKNPKCQFPKEWLDYTIDAIYSKY